MSDGNDNSPEWGWCKAWGCREEAYPLWFSGAYPDDPDLLYCNTHIGLYIAGLREWIRDEGARTDICTYDILGKEVCSFCRCERRTTP